MDYCDINLKCVDVSKSQQNHDYLKLLISCIKDGYYNIALNNEVKDFSKPLQLCGIKPIELNVLEDYLKADLSMQKFLPKLEHFKQYTRLTLVINDTKNLGQLQETSKILQSYDLLAVKTNNEKIFNELCLNYDFIDIITTDVQDKAFIMKRGHVQEAMKKGIFFEITYNQSLTTQEKKRNIFQNLLRLIKSLKGNNVIITSEGSNFLYHRSPYDLIAIFKILELNNDKVYHALKQNQLLCIQRSKYRKSFKGTITMANDKDKQYFQIKEQQNNERIEKKIKKTKMILQDQSQDDKQKLLGNLRQRFQKQKKINQEKQDIEQVLEEENISQSKKKQKQEQQQQLEGDQKQEQKDSGDILGFTIDTQPTDN